MLVKKASDITANTRYRRIDHLTRSQYACSHTVVTTFDTSSAVPIIIIGITAAAKIATSPNMLYHAAIMLKVSAVTKVRLVRLNIFFENIRIFSQVSLPLSSVIPNKCP